MDEELVLVDLKRDLQDGDDLATAVSLVSDAVQRRIRRVQRSLDLLDVDEDDTAAVRQRLQAVLDRYQRALDEQGRSLRLIVEQYQPRLEGLAEELGDVAVDGDD